ncbi:MAG TPA: hypothetical protein VK738_18915 [Terriglobales bacterium]|jgi:hypothetical protein|nr:hypothetical protein [Terriglobales bacterium]
MRNHKCIDRVVGRILAGWRYDISGIAPEMRGDYEEHLAQCQHCRSKRVLHRVIDFGLITIATISAAIFLLAFSLVRHYSPSHVVILELIALAGFLFSSLMWIIVAVATPVPVMLIGAAKEGARRMHERLPQEIRERLPLKPDAE